MMMTMKKRKTPANPDYLINLERTRVAQEEEEDPDEKTGETVLPTLPSSKRQMAGLTMRLGVIPATLKSILPLHQAKDSTAMLLKAVMAQKEKNTRKAKDMMKDMKKAAKEKEREKDKGKGKGKKSQWLKRTCHLSLALLALLLQLL
jgi:hypothetical protein